MVKRSKAKLGAEWAKLSAANAKFRPRDGAGNDLHLRLTFPEVIPKKPEGSGV